MVSNCASLHQPQQVRKLQRQRALRRKHLAQAGDEIVDVRHMGEHVVAQHQVAAAPPGDEAAREVQAEELAEAFDAARARRGGRACGGLDADAGNVALLQVLQQVAVVRRHLHHQRARPQGQPLHHLPNIVARMRQPRGRVGREVHIVAAEQRLGALDLVQLHQAAFGTGQRPQWQVRLAPLQRIGIEKGVRRRSAAQVDEQIVARMQRRGAMAAVHAARPSASARSGCNQRSLRSRADTHCAGSGQRMSSKGSS